MHDVQKLKRGSLIQVNMKPETGRKGFALTLTNFLSFSIVLGMLMKICCSFYLSIKKVQNQNWLTETRLFLQISGIHKEKHSLILMLIPECLACQLFSCYCEVNTSTVSIWKNLAEECSGNTRQISQCWWITHYTSKLSHSHLPFFKPITRW